MRAASSLLLSADASADDPAATRQRRDAGSGDATAPAPVRTGVRRRRTRTHPPRRHRFDLPRPLSRWRCYRAIVPIPRRYTTDAIVLSRFDYGEADRILTLITPGGGKLKAIAKGIRRPTSRIGGSLEPFAELNVLLARGRTFDVVTQVSVGHAWLNLRDSLESAATAWYLAELADRSLEERHARGAGLHAPASGPTSCSTPGWRPGGSPAGTRCTSPTSSASGRRSTAASSATASSRPTAGSAGCPPLGGVLCDRCPGPPHDRTGLSLDGAEAPEGVPAPGRRGARRAAAGRRDGARGRGRDARLHPPRPRARRAVARVPRRGPPRAARDRRRRTPRDDAGDAPT